MNRKFLKKIGLAVVVAAVLAFTLEALQVLSAPLRFERSMMNGSRSVLEEVELSFTDPLVEGSAVAPVSGAAQMLVDRLEGVIRKITFSLTEPLLEDTACRLFYPDGYGDFSEENMVMLTAEAGQTDLLFELPMNYYPYLRLEIDASFALKDISFEGTHILKAAVAPTFDFSRAAVLFAVMLPLSVFLSLRRKKERKALILRLKDRVTEGWRAGLIAAGTVVVMAFVGYFAGRLSCTLAGILFNAYKGAFFVILGVAAGFLWAMRKQAGDRPERWFLVIALSAGLMLATLVPVSTVVTWDDTYHYVSALELSYLGRLQITQAEQDIIEAAYPLSFELEETEKQHQALNRAYEEGVFEDDEVEIWSYRSFGYIPAALGLWLGRLLRMPFTDIFRCGRAMSLIAYVVVVYLGIRRMKSGRVLASLAALLPTALFQAASYTYDAWLISFVIFGTAWFIGELQTSDRTLTLSSCVVMLGALFVGLGPKPIYFPVILLLLLLPRSKFKSSSHLILYRVAVVAVSLTVLALYLVPTVGNTATTFSDTRGGDEVNGRDQIAFILGNPLSYTGILLKFLWKYLSLEAANGYTVFFAYLGMGKHHILSIVLLLLAAVTDRGEGDLRLEGWHRRGFAMLLSFATVSLVATGMYIYFTPVGLGAINGCQPRYLLPLIFPFLAFALNTRVRHVSQRRGYNAALYLLSAFILYANVWTLVVSQYV